MFTSQQLLEAVEHVIKTQMELLYDSHSPYSEPDDCDCSKSAQHSTSGEYSELNSQFARAHDSSNQERTMQYLAGRGQSPVIGKSAISLNTRLLSQSSGGSISGKTSALLQESATRQVSPYERLNILVVSLLEEYFSVQLLDEALQCVKELNCPAYHLEVVKKAISLGLDKSPPRVEPVTELLEYLFERKIFTTKDIESGCLLYGTMLDDDAIDLPKAPNNFGEIIGKLVLAGVLDFKVVNEVVEKVEDDRLQKVLFGAAMHVVSSTPSDEGYAAGFTRI